MAKEIFYHRNSFERADSYEQLLSAPIEQDFLSFDVEAVSDKSIVAPKSRAWIFALHTISLDVKRTISSRQIYSLMQFLGDIGGF